MPRSTNEETSILTGTETEIANEVRRTPGTAKLGVQQTEPTNATLTE